MKAKNIQNQRLMCNVIPLWMFVICRSVGTSLLQQTIFDINYLEDHNILSVMKISLGNLAYWSFLKCFSELSEKIFVIRLKWLEPATFCIRDKDATTTPARHI